MTKVTMRDYDLRPDSDLDDEANQDSFFEYRLALEREIVDHYRASGEMIPMSVVSSRLCDEFGITLDRHWRIVQSAVDRIDDGDTVELEDLLDADDLADLMQFIAERLEESAKERELFDFLSNDF
jgi:hypothetical protein